MLCITFHFNTVWKSDNFIITAEGQVICVRWFNITINNLDDLLCRKVFLLADIQIALFVNLGQALPTWPLGDIIFSSAVELQIHFSDSARHGSVYSYTILKGTFCSFQTLSMQFQHWQSKLPHFSCSDEMQPIVHYLQVLRSRNSLYKN